MKVMCIDDTPSIVNKIKLPFKVGDILTAKQSQHYPKNYNILEYPTLCGMPVSFAKKRFVPLSDVDETELVKEREQELVNI